jgi:hypothetical protein
MIKPSVQARILPPPTKREEKENVLNSLKLEFDSKSHP